MNVAILGAGQLGQMLALAGIPLDIRPVFLDPQPDAPGSRLATQLLADYTDHAALDQLARICQVATFDFENVPVEAANHLAQRIPVYPPPHALEQSQDRLREKTLFRSLGIPTAPFQAVDSLAELEAAVARLGLPAILKTRRLGYDGKGQAWLRDRGDCASAWHRLGGQDLIVEGVVAFRRELSLMAVRGRDGQQAFYPLTENWHADGILRLSQPAAPDAALQAQAERYGQRLLEQLDYVGVLALELFDCEHGLLANEFAPRVHNSGHWTIEGSVTSQFENHLRAIVGLPLGETTATGCCAMRNCIGSLPAMDAVLAIPGTHYHSYGKAPRPGRKLGHITITAPHAEDLASRLQALEAVVSGCPDPGLKQATP
jgi:5-(carboxyamino)imidazole ribonucleotide synthase